ncbi:hypothetical protein EGW08_022126 [Elysia chlorotica]|uniref:Uncharacterized protein n=1 Tax=Elysia chlorotica TaxID=188477 RepID=A0A3S1ARL4_ELYCH|nr:hypothetical protein EGW08_022126 [Elysia chlorotica]
MALVGGLTKGQFERLAVTLFPSQVFLRNRLSFETKHSKPMSDSIPKVNHSRLSERCHLVQAPERESWPWPVNPTKVLVVMLTWLGAKDRHILRYSHLYTKQGLDVLIVKSEAKDFIWPRNSIALAEQVHNVLENQMKEYNHIISHSMSVGSFNWTVIRRYLKQKENAEHICQKFKGQIYDSVVAGAGKGGLLDESPAEGRPEVHALDRMVHGIVVSRKLGPKMQWMIESLTKAYFSVTKRSTVRFYEKALKYFREEPLHIPTLFLTSRDDPMCDASVLERLVDIWEEEHNFKVSIKVWDNSPHAQHYLHHQEEYESLQQELFKEIFMSKESPAHRVKSNL